MGFFGWIFEKIESAVERVREVAEDIVDGIKDFLGLGYSDPYTGSVRESIDIEKVLNGFKEKLFSLIDTREKDYINIVLFEIDQFTDSLEGEYSDLASEVKNRKGRVQERLKGTMRDYAGTRLSENDSNFRKVLEMNPGEEKENELKRYQDRIMDLAEKEFKAKLKDEMDGLYKETSIRIDRKLTEKQNALSKKEREYKELQKKAEQGDLNLEEVEWEYIPVAEAAKCVDYLFSCIKEETV